MPQVRSWRVQQTLRSSAAATERCLAAEEQKKAYEKSKLTTLKRMPARASYDQVCLAAGIVLLCVLCESVCNLNTTRLLLVVTTGLAEAVRLQAVVHAILDEALIVHVAYQFEGKSFCMPQAFARLGQTLFMHGSITNRMLKTMKASCQQCPLSRRWSNA